MPRNGWRLVAAAVLSLGIGTWTAAPAEAANREDVAARQPALAVSVHEAAAPEDRADHQLRFDAQISPRGSLMWGLYYASGPAARRLHTTMRVFVNDRLTTWRYSPHVTSADYLWHASISRYRCEGDEPGAKRALQAGDVVKVRVRFEPWDDTVSVRPFTRTFEMPIHEV